VNFKTFLAMLGRDAQVARRNLITLLLQTFLQPLMFVFIFGRVMVGSGFMPPAYKSLLLPGIMALSMVGTGIWAVAMPLISEFQFTREIEDRLLAPMEISWVAVEKVVFGTVQALAAGLMVIDTSALIAMLNVHFSRVADLAAPDHIVIIPSVPISCYRDGFGNWCSRIVAPAGHVRLSTDAVVTDSGQLDPVVT